MVWRQQLNKRGGNKCGSDDCLTDTNPASASSNVTNDITLTITADTAYASKVTCDTELSEGGNELYQGETGYVDYTITNTGFEDDSYTFVTTISSGVGASTVSFNLNSGLSNGKTLIGTSNSVGNLQQYLDSVLQFLRMLDLEHIRLNSLQLQQMVVQTRDVVLTF